MDVKELKDSYSNLTETIKVIIIIKIIMKNFNYKIISFLIKWIKYINKNTKNIN